MANFFLDNQDIQFLFNHIDLQEIARLQELHTEDGDADYAPLDAADMVDNYRRTLEIVGSVAAETIAPNAETVDREGNTLNENGTVTLHPCVHENLHRMSQAELMGFTLPRKYGGPELPEPDVHDGHRDRVAGRCLVHEHVRPAGNRRDHQCLRQPGNQR